MAADLADLDLADAHEARARALHALDQADEATLAWRAAHDLPIASPHR